MSSLDPLRDDLARLERCLLGAVGELSGDAARELILSLRDDAIALRAGRLAGGRDAFASRFAHLADADLERVASAFTQWCHLMNVAEEQQRIRALRGRASSPDGLAAAVTAMHDAGMSADEVSSLLGGALFMPVLTAHPTEARRRSMIDHLGAVAGSLDRLALPLGDGAHRDAAEALDDAVLALYATEESRARKPTPIDEIEASIEVFRRTLLEVTPRIYRTLEDALARLWPERTWRVPSFLRWGTWVGGDRDGNPNVTAPVMRTAFERQRAAVLGRYLEDVQALGRALSVSERRVADPTALEPLVASLEIDRARMPEAAARAQVRTIHEPWREKLWYMATRLRATLARGDDGYLDAAAYARDLALMGNTLAAAGFGRLARDLVRASRRRADVFGFHLASIDLRQHSSVHERIVDELLTAGGKPGYLGMHETARVRLLSELLARPVPPVRDRTHLSDEAQDLLATIDMIGRARHELGERACERWIVSFTSSVSDLLEITFLGRSAGLAPGELRPVPLLEQLEDLDNAGKLAEQMLASPPLRGELGGELEVMVGYSDSGKQVGYVPSQVALRRAQLALAAVAKSSGVTLTIFHGRGGAIGRGGGPASLAIRAQPEAALRGRMRVTEQGETVTARYGRAEIAERDLELTVGAVLFAEVDERTHCELPIDRALEAGAAAALPAYRSITSDKPRLARYTVAATPITYVSRLAIGSRPASRKRGAELTIDDLRAIPWVFSWTQSRHGLPGWFGVGSALEAMAATLGAAEVRRLAESSRFVHALIANAELAMIRSDIDVAAQYARLAGGPDGEVFAPIKDEFERTRRALVEIVGHADPFADRPHLAESVARRNPYIDVLSHVQIELMRRDRAGRSNAGDGVLITIGGIAAGLQTAG
ncbi:MAG TPA: phosphoenolpyruvate carboxylase [Kofleriaceae bacterium]|nr:phosphoenolpyruvate carboxylase [Kofleriaceae bacterium]